MLSLLLYLSCYLDSGMGAYLSVGLMYGDIGLEQSFNQEFKNFRVCVVRIERCYRKKGLNSSKNLTK